MITGLVTFVTYGGIGAEDNIWIAAIELVDPALVVVALIIGRNLWTRPSGYDIGATAFACVALVFHVLLHRNGFAMLAYVSAITADICGALQVVLHSWENPEEEQPIPWAVSIVGTIVGFFSISTPSIAQLSLPTYQLVFCLLVFTPTLRFWVRSKTPISQWW